MRSLLGAVGVLLVLNGAAGLAHEANGRCGAWSLVHRIAGPLEGMEIFANLVLIVLGVAVCARAGRVRRPG
ncbi:hypothetical protein [Streptomyces sp. G-5]|uniref:hypothetical protein n=1 Tax=Streptomyces sp. G-5 TaxID=2977231 RepID=UPI0021CFA492|nr:hypothetical protein [Streptomyces sp. G-5]MCU4750035.1 hypothetical protein [Streptomyces sp. G-5]